MSRTSANAVPPSHRRDAAVDVVRALALLSMFVAHAVPYAPGDWWELSDFLTAALFATLVGVGAGLSDRAGPGRLRVGLVRGAVLVGVGLLLEQAGAQVVVILVHLGLLTWVVAVIRPLPSWALGVTGAWLALVAPLLQQSWQDEYRALLGGGHQVTARVVDLVFTGTSYRLTTLTIWAIAGLLLARHLLRVRSGATAGVVGGSALFVALAVYATSDWLLGGAELVPYSGRIVEIGFNTVLASGVLLLGSWAARRRPSGVLMHMGQMSLSVYTAHVLWLALLGRTFFVGRLDDSWATFGSLVAGAVLLAAAWSRVPETSPWGRGPLEAASDALVSRTRRAR